MKNGSQNGLLIFHKRFINIMWVLSGWSPKAKNAVQQKVSRKRLGCSDFARKCWKLNINHLHQQNLWKKTNRMCGTNCI